MELWLAATVIMAALLSGLAIGTGIISAWDERVREKDRGQI